MFYLGQAEWNEINNSKTQNSPDNNKNNVSIRSRTEGEICLVTFLSAGLMMTLYTFCCFPITELDAYLMDDGRTGAS